MIPIQLLNDQHVVGTPKALDGEGFAVPGSTVDAGSLAGTFSPDATELGFTANADGTFTVTALGPVTVPTTLSVTGTADGGTPLTPFTQDFVVAKDVPSALGADFGAPAQN